MKHGDIIRECCPDCGSTNISHNSWCHIHETPIAEYNKTHMSTAEFKRLIEKNKIRTLKMLNEGQEAMLKRRDDTSKDFPTRNQAAILHCTLTNETDNIKLIIGRLEEVANEVPHIQQNKPMMKKMRKLIADIKGVKQ